MPTSQPSEPSDGERPSRAARTVRRFGPSALALAVLVGVVLSIGGYQAVEATNRLEFCVSCHEMKDNNYSEYKDTIHARNRTGVTATCGDCHVPHGFMPVAARKLMAANDVWHHLLGTEDTKDKFEAHRLELAMKVWRHMKTTDSAECRNCHNAHAMDPEAQGPTARKQHQKIGKDGRTCIDCHYGIAHEEPQGGFEPADALRADAPH